MLQLIPDLPAGRPLQLLCIGAHSDDLEIGCGGSMLSWLAGSRPIAVTWVVLSACGDREREARKSARALLRRSHHVDLVFRSFRDGFFAADYIEVKSFFETLKAGPTPDLVLTHRIEDRHQDHRLVGELTWNTFRDQLILEYEIQKYEGDLGHPNLYVPLTARTSERKATHLQRHFGTQRSKHWFRGENFLALARLRGIECRAADGYAEAFHARKLVLPVLG